MTFSISRTHLSAIMASLGKVINSNDSMPIRTNVLIHEQDGRYIATASNEEQALHIVLQLDEVKDFQPLCIPFAQFAALVKAIGDGFFPVVFRTGKHIDGGQTDNLQLNIDYGEGEYNIIMANAAEYPSTNIGQISTTVKLPKNVIQMASEASNFCAKDDLRPVMNGVYFDIIKADDGSASLNVVASDTKTLYCRTLHGIEAEASNGVILFKNCISILNTLSVPDDGFSFSISDKYIVAETSDFRLESRRIEGRYPRYEAVLPKAFAQTVLVNSKDFTRSIERASVVANTTTDQIRFDFVQGQGNVRVSASDVDTSRDGHTLMQLADGGANIKSSMSFGFRANFLLKAVKAVSASEVTLCMNEPNKAAVLTDATGDIRVLIMPMMLS